MGYTIFTTNCYQERLTPVITPTNETRYRLYEEENLATIDIDEDLLNRTKQKGRWKALKTPLAETENEEPTGGQGVKKRAVDSSSDEDEKPKHDGEASSSKSSE